MADAAFHNVESFERAICQLIDKADAQNRGDDLDRLVHHVLNTPQEVSDLAGLMFMVDEDFRPALEAEVEAYRRWLKRKGRPADDQSITEALLAAYRKKRGSESDGPS